MQKLGDAAWITTTESGEDAEKRLRMDSETPPFAPFYWAVREHRKGDLGGQGVVKKIRGLSDGM